MKKRNFLLFLKNKQWTKYYIEYFVLTWIKNMYNKRIAKITCDIPLVITNNYSSQNMKLICGELWKNMFLSHGPLKIPLTIKMFRGIENPLKYN